MEAFTVPTEEEEEEEEDWFHPQPAAGQKERGKGDEGCAQPRPLLLWRPRAGPSRPEQAKVIIHLDLDCFYAQVEMLCKPGLRNKPLGVQQKSIVVTSNYEARKLGVKKLMSIKDALERCPQLILVNGEDLSPYREMSSKVTDLLRTFCPLVERLGLDENFVDVTELVEKRLQELQPCGPSEISVSGHIYKDQAINWWDLTHLKLVVGSKLAEDFRRALASHLGLTACAGVATSKVLSKLVSGTFKPNQQTLLLPESSQELLNNLEDIQKVPGIGSKTAKRLQMLGVRNISDLQKVPPGLLEKEFGLSAAQRLQKLSCGEDDSPVTPSGPPQSFSDEDSFKKCSSEAEVKKKVEELLPNLLSRVSKDGRQPHTIRLTIRRFSTTTTTSSSSSKWLGRESRQCPVPPQLLQRFGRDSSNLLPSLVEVLMRLFHKMVDVTQPFHLTLLNVSFTNLREVPSSKKGSIGFYLKEMSPAGGAGKRLWEDVSGDAEKTSWKENFSQAPNPKSRKVLEVQMEKLGSPSGSFQDIAQEVFHELPEAIQEEVLSEGPRGDQLEETSRSSAPDPKGAKMEPSSNLHLEEPAAAPSNISRTSEEAFWSSQEAPPEAGSKSRLGQGHEATQSNQGVVELPPGVDRKTFWELPPDVQKELLEEWKSGGGKRTSWKASGRSKGGPKLRESNTLLRYLKPLGGGGGEDNSKKEDLGR